MKKIRENKGFTLAELLIVVAIIAVLVAIAIPVFRTQLEKSREATDIANVRAAYATLMTEYLQNTSASSIVISAQAKTDTWETSPAPVLETMIDGTVSPISIPAKGSGGTYTVEVDASGNVTVK